MVADRGLLSLDNLEAIRELRVGQALLEFILAVPARRYGEFDELLADFHHRQCQPATEEVVGELAWQGLRLVVAHDPAQAKAQGAARDARIAALEADAARWANKLTGQEAGYRYRGRKLSDGGVTAKFYRAVCDAHLANILRVDLSSKDFVYDLDETALQRARLLDGKLLMVTNMPDHTSVEVVQRYKSLADIERGFRVLKSEIEIAPMYHRLPDRIRAHAFICFLALVLYRVLRLRLKAHQSPYSSERMLEIVRRIQFHQVTLHRRESAAGLSTLTPEQKDLFDAVNLPLPAASAL